MPIEEPLRHRRSTTLGTDPRRHPVGQRQFPQTSDAGHGRLTLKRRKITEVYVHLHWYGLQTFLFYGRVEIDSNNVETLVFPNALNRKNALFAGHDEGGKAWGRIAPLIETAKINGVEPFAYMKYTLEASAAGHAQSRIDDPLPWN